MSKDETLTLANKAPGSGWRVSVVELIVETQPPRRKMSRILVSGDAEIFNVLIMLYLLERRSQFVHPASLGAFV
jgi:hypothetical protein